MEHGATGGGSGAYASRYSTYKKLTTSTEVSADYRCIRRADHIRIEDGRDVVRARTVERVHEHARHTQSNGRDVERK